MRRFVLAALFIIAVISFSSCSTTMEYTPVDGYFDAIDTMDFEEAYTYVADYRENISREEYIDTWDKLVVALRITDISITAKQIDEDMVSYTAVYSSDLVGEMENNYSAKIYRDEEKSQIEFAYDLFLPFMEEGDYVRSRTVEAHRGEIYANDGRVLATNDFSETVYIDMTKQPNKQDVISALGLIVEIDEKKIGDAYDTALARNYSTVIVKDYNKNTLDELTREKFLAIEGVGISTSITEQRHYPYGASFAHVLGYVGEVSSLSEDNMQKHIDLGYETDDLVGITGLESAFEEYLKSEDGYTVELVNEDGEKKQTYFYEEPVMGNDLYTTLDVDMQEQHYFSLLTHCNEEQTGAAVYLDGYTGAVEVLISYPSYDNNEFLYPISDETYANWIDPELGLPLIPRATQGLYAPGSTFKPFTAALALDDGTITASTVFPYQHEISGNSWTPDLPDWYYPPISRWDKTSGTLDFTNAMRNSDNIYFGWIALQYTDEEFLAYLDKIGFTEAVPFELGAAKPNIINENTEMNQKLRSDMGYGMGEFQITPIQIGSMYTAFLNSGDMIVPYVVEKASHFDTDGTEVVVYQHEKELFREDTMSDSAIDAIMQSLSVVMQEGTGQQLRVEGMDLVGKTGTAPISSGENGGQSRSISWMVSWPTNLDDTQISVITIDGPAEIGGEVKVNVAMEAYKRDMGAGEAPPDELFETSVVEDDEPTTDDEPSTGDEPNADDEPSTGDEPSADS